MLRGRDPKIDEKSKDPVTSTGLVAQGHRARVGSARLTRLGVLSLACATACQQETVDLTLDVHFTLPANSQSTLDQVAEYRVVLDYLSADSVASVYEYTLHPGEAEGGLREGIRPTTTGESARIRIDAYGSDPSAPLFQGSSGRFVIDEEALNPLQIFLGRPNTLDRLSGPLLTARRSHTASLLADGTVLIAGGTDEAGMALSTAERFDSGWVSGLFGASGNALDMSVARAHHTSYPMATPDQPGSALGGKVLLVGGDPEERLELVNTVMLSSTGVEYEVVLPILSVDTSIAPLGSWQTFDPATGAFSAPASIPGGAITWQASAALSSEMFLACGGLEPVEGGVAPSQRCLVADEDQLAAGLRLNQARVLHQATALSTGAVLITGGLSDPTFSAGAQPISTPFVEDAELYRFTDTTNHDTRSMKAPRAGHSAVLLEDEHVLISGGYVRVNVSGSGLKPEWRLTLTGALETFDPAAGESDAFRIVGALALPRAFHTSTLLPDGNVLILGGVDRDGATTLPAELYVVEENCSILLDTGDMTLTDLTGITVSKLPQGSFLISGGTVQDGEGTHAGTVHVYSPGSIDLASPETLCD